MSYIITLASNYSATLQQAHKHTRQLCCALALASSAVVLSGCIQNTAGIQVQHNESSPESTLVQASTKLGQLEIKKINGQFINGLYAAQIELKNTKSSTQSVQYQVTWVDAQGNTVPDSTSGWTPIVIYGQAAQTIRAISPYAEATGFLVSIRDLKANKTFKTNILGIE